MRGYRGNSRRFWAAASVGLWAVVALASCSAAPEPRMSNHSDPHLYEAVFRAISAHYLDPISAETLALAGLDRLNNIDSSISISHDGKKVSLRQYRDAVLEQTQPAGDDNRGWGEVTGAVLDAARQRSAVVAAASEDKLDQTVIDGSVALLDRFSRYAPPVVASERRDSRDGYGGIGVTLDTEGPDVRIAMVMPDSPASAAGLATGDRITAVDGIDAVVLTHDDLVHRLRGPIGSDVQLTVAREGKSDRLNVMLKRGQIVIKTVTLKHDDHIAVLRISSFNARTAENAAELLVDAHREMGSALTGLVLDLRGDPGGLLDQSVRVASLFLDHGTVVSTEGRAADSRQVFEVDRRIASEHLPLVVLVNGGSASASEIVASALQDNGRAVIVGTASFGKGTVQNVVHLPNQGELTVTWARLVPPGNYILHEHGVVPAVCTADLSDATRAAPLASPPRAGLDEAGWKQLRDRCPPDRAEHEIDLKVAKELLGDPARYAQALADEPQAPAKPLRAASVASTFR
jgi:carboxyl-terminal processing protease